MTAIHRALARFAVIGPQPPWWRPVKRRQWLERRLAILAAYHEEAMAELAVVLAPYVERRSSAPEVN